MTDSYEHDPMDYRIVGSARGASIELAWQAFVAASSPRPGVQPPTRCQLIDPPGDGHTSGSWSRRWASMLDFGEAVGWPSHHDGTVQRYQFVGISTPSAMSEGTSEE